ncbi:MULTISPECIES: hypothetical protein [Bacillaceae]|uniref:Uncharacterized protein n=1 Tax=Evansella alkalicola TaxID=745819 RepID=A0ABS6JZU9_9BACI|nr:MULTISPECIES: hypothetical protein [Bacillaceae]MBU9724123.1 hypothetical protein [Bacillus alkalicola]
MSEQKELEVVEQEETKIEIRDPNSTDIMTVFRVIGKMKIRKELSSLGKRVAEMNRLYREGNKLNSKEEKTNTETAKARQLLDEAEEIQTELGMEWPFIILENIDKAEADVYKFLASLIGKSEKEYKQMHASNTLQIIFEIKNNEQWVKVFTDALKLLRK